MRKVAVTVEREKCHPNKCQHECMKYDPINRSGGEGFHLGPSGKAEIDEKIVQEFHSICAKMCPFQAIHLVNLPEKLNEDPIHRYGQNQFELFRLPIPKKNTVVGILGRNGIGKSTALEILSGNLKPNLGSFKEPPGEHEILSKFSSIVLREYFKDLFDKKITISYKPQRVDLIPKFYKGTVNNLIKKVDDKGIGKELMQELELEHLKEKNVSDLSGGELQKTAIIAACVKNADFYYFDEPASFLDITSRMNATKVIKQIKNASVMVTEHDLATLDYISDEMQMIYGEPAAYGIISQSKAVKRGINEYLDGYLPDENVKFRDYSIVYTRPVFAGVVPKILFTFQQIEKQYPGFKLKINQGSVKVGETLAVMGPNGLGKTTFLKILAGIEKPDSGSIDNLDISYKPQYIRSFEGVVEDFLKEKAGSLFESGWYKTNILEKLGLSRILKNEINFLSGGELQKVHIAACLSQKASVYALDEPSAFIDVEDRLNVAEVIREFAQKREVSSIVVDHDVQFVNYIADSMLVFEGIPGKEGHVFGPCSKEEGMNRVLKMLDITYRLDKGTQRPRINKPDSQLDKKQKSTGKYYYN